MSRLNIKSITGIPPYEIYVSDQYMNNKTLITTINESIPPQQFFYLPDLFDGIDRIILIIKDSSGCDSCNFFKLLDCRFGCAFNVFIQEVGCNLQININNKKCEINKLSIIQ
jgi:hypothetical protein